jgi:hypothetical protein
VRRQLRALGRAWLAFPSSPALCFIWLPCSGFFFPTFSPPHPTLLGCTSGLAKWMDGGYQNSPLEDKGPHGCEVVA